MDVPNICHPKCQSSGRSSPTLQLSMYSRDLKSDTQASKILNETCHFNGSRYSVGMLWQAEHIKLRNTFGQAKAHLLSLERRLEQSSGNQSSLF